MELNKQKIELEKRYYLYKKESREIVFAYSRARTSVLTYSFLSFLIGVGCFYIGIYFDELGYGIRTTLSWGFWLSILFGIYIGVSGGVRVKRQLNDAIINAAKNNTGFAEFFGLYRKQYWSNEFPTGEKYQTFLSLIDTQESHNTL